MRIVMLATGDIAIPSFRVLRKGNHLVALVTQPDRPVGRHQTLTPPRVKECAQEQGIPVLQPESLKSPDSIAALKAFRPDYLVVIAYGQILSQEVIGIPRKACINVHASLLPRHRGASCVQAAIDAGDAETGVTIMHVVRKLDAGDIILQEKLPLKGIETADELHDMLAELAPKALMQALQNLESGKALREEQDEQLASYAPKLLRADGKIDWNQPSFIIARKIRAYHSWPGSFTTYPSVRKGDDRLLKIYPPVDVVSIMPVKSGAVPGEVIKSGQDGLYVACHPGIIRINTLQPEGRRKMNAESFFSGHSIYPGMILGVPKQRDELA